MSKHSPLLAEGVNIWTLSMFKLIMLFVQIFAPPENLNRMQTVREVIPHQTMVYFHCLLFRKLKTIVKTNFGLRRPP